MPVAYPLVAEIRATLAAHADPQRAAAQQRYMKSALPYYGLTMTALRPALRPVIAANPLADWADWRDTIEHLWTTAGHREEWYAALAIARHRVHAAHRAAPPSLTLPLYRRLVVGGAWWDVVDEIATQLVRETLARHRPTAAEALRAWATTPTSRPGALWVRRAAIVCQVGAKADVDRQLLYDAIEASRADEAVGGDFFIRKAIGWALRDLARTDPQWVRDYVDGHELSGLSRREATKHLGPP